MLRICILRSVMDKKTHPTNEKQNQNWLWLDRVHFPVLAWHYLHLIAPSSHWFIVHTQFTSFCFDWSVRVFLALVLVLWHSIEIDCDLPMSWGFLTQLLSFYSVPSAAYHYPLFLQDVTRQRIVTKRLHSGTVVMLNDVVLINM